MSDKQILDVGKTIKRLEIIKSLIFLEEDDEIEAHLVKLEELPVTDDLKIILSTIKSKAYSKAIMGIETFINSYNQLSFYLDPEVEALKLEIKGLEVEVNNLSIEKADIEKLIHEFGIRHNKELGELIIKILKLRKAKAKDTPQQKEADDDYDTYRKEYDDSKNEIISSLTQDEQMELRDEYRKASKLCHPDVVSDEQKELATKLFTDLSMAYEKNNLNKVREILENLENGNFFVSKSEVSNQKQLLYGEMEKLRLRIKEIYGQLEILKESDTYKTIISITNWDNYFKNAKDHLQLQLKNIEDGK